MGTKKAPVICLANQTHARAIFAGGGANRATSDQMRIDECALRLSPYPASIR